MPCDNTFLNSNVLFNFQGAVYVKCSNAEVAASASKALHGRWFAGRFIRLVPFHPFADQFVVVSMKC